MSNLSKMVSSRETVSREVVSSIEFHGKKMQC